MDTDGPERKLISGADDDGELAPVLPARNSDVVDTYIRVTGKSPTEVFREAMEIELRSDPDARWGVVNKCHQKIKASLQDNYDPITVHFKMSEKEQCVLREAFPEMEIRFTNSSFHSHALAAATRNVEEIFMIKQLMKNAVRTSEGVQIVDVGGNYIRHYLSKRKIHSCCPALTPRDAARASKRAVQYNRFEKTKSQMRFDLEFAAKTTSFGVNSMFCHSKAQDCPLPCESLMFVHSTYDMSEAELYSILSNKGAVRAYAVFMFDPKIFVEDKGEMRYGACFEKYKDPKTSRTKIKFFFNNSLDITYVHDFDTYLFLATASVLRDENGAVAYWLERILRPNGTLFVEMVRNITEFSAGVSNTTLSFNYGNDKLVVETYLWDTSLNATADPNYRLKRRAILIDRKLYEAAYKWTLSRHDMAFTIQNVETAIAQLGSRVIINGNDVTNTGNSLNPQDIPTLAVVIYLKIYEERYNQSKVLGLLKNEIDRIRERPSFFRQVGNVLRHFSDWMNREVFNNDEVDDPLGKRLRTQWLLWRSDSQLFSTTVQDMVCVYNFYEYVQGANVQLLQDECVPLPWHKDKEAMLEKELHDSCPMYSDLPLYTDTCVEENKQLQYLRVPADGDCGFFALAKAAGLPLSPLALRNRLLDSPYLTVENPTARREIVNRLAAGPSSSAGWCDDSVIKLFAFTFARRVCIHDESGSHANYQVYGKLGDPTCHIVFSSSHFDALVEAPDVPTMTFVERVGSDTVGRVRSILARVEISCTSEAVLRACRLQITKAPYAGKCRDVFVVYEVMGALARSFDSLALFSSSLAFLRDMGNPNIPAVADVSYAPEQVTNFNEKLSYFRMYDEDFDVETYIREFRTVDFAYIRDQENIESDLRRLSLIFTDTSVLLLRIRKFEDETNAEMNVRCVSLVAAAFSSVRVVEPVSVHARSTDVYLVAHAMKVQSQPDPHLATKLFQQILSCLMHRLTMLERVCSRPSTTRNIPYQAAEKFFSRYYSTHYSLKGGGNLMSILDEDVEFAEYAVNQQQLAVIRAAKIRKGVEEPLYIRDFDVSVDSGISSPVDTDAESEEETVVIPKRIKNQNELELEDDSGLQIQSSHFDCKYPFGHEKGSKNSNAFFINAATEQRSLWAAYTRTVEAEAFEIFSELQKINFNMHHIQKTFAVTKPNYTLRRGPVLFCGEKDVSEYMYKLVWDSKTFTAKFVAADARTDDFELYTPFTKLALERKFLNATNDVSFDKKFAMPELQLVKGVPGCGKTRYIVETHDKGKDLVLTNSREGRQQFLHRMPDCDPSFYRTVGSYLIHDHTQHDTVWVDEVYMMHPGVLLFVAALTKCKTMYLVGDPCQIPYINRLVLLTVKYGKLPSTIKVAKTLNVSWRVPQDVVKVLKDTYAEQGIDFQTNSKVEKSITLQRISAKDSIPIEADVILTFKQTEAEEMRKYVKLHPNRRKTPVHTIHEYQGGEHDAGVIWRGSAIESDTIYTSSPHIVVALTRHKKHLTYCIPASLGRNTADGIYRLLIKHIPDFRMIGGGDDLALRTAERYFALNTIVASEHQPDVLENEYREYASFRIPLPSESNLHITDLQNVYDTMRPGHSAVDLTYDAWIVQNSDLSVDVDQIEVNTLNFTHKAKRMGFLQPRLRTSCPIIRDTTAKECLLALLKRNKNVPDIKFNMNDYELAELMFAKFMQVFVEHPNCPEKRIEPDLTATAEWLSQQSVTTFANAEDESLNLRLRRLNEYRFSIKRNAKPKLDDSALNEYLSLQTICYQGPYTNVLLCPIFREVRKRIMTRLKKKYLVFVDMSVQDLENKMTAMNIPAEYEPIEVDISKYDKSQGLVHLLFEMKIYEFFGLPAELCILWRHMHECTILYDTENRIKTNVVYQRKSGDAATFLGNTLVLMGTLCCMFDFRQIYAGIFAGDDSLLFSRRKMRFDNHAMANAFGFDSKLLSNRYSMFCSKFVLRVDGRWKVVPDLLKLLTKLGRHDLRNWDHVELYYISTKDQIVQLNDVSVLVELTKAIKERYEVDISPSGISRIVNFLKNRELFKTLYMEPKGVPLMKVAPMKLADI